MGATLQFPDMADAMRQRFLGAMSRGVSMVNVVTTDGVAGRFGATVSAMVSLSADMSPPTLLVSLNRSSATAVAIAQNGVFCVNVLRESQQDVADCFAGRVRVKDKFDCASWSRGMTGGWRLTDAVASFDCRVLKSELVGTHYLIIGSTEWVSADPDGRALLYGDRAYCAAVSLPERSTAF